LASAPAVAAHRHNPSILMRLMLLLADLVQLSQRLAEWTTVRQQQAMRPVFLIRHLGHRAQGGVFLVRLRQGNHVISHIIGDVSSANGCFHDYQDTSSRVKYQS
jgi:hypothetical protein